MNYLNLIDSDHTEALGAALWQAAPEKYRVFLLGDLGAGKTTLVRGLLRAAGYDGTVKSPTYNLLESYRIGEREVLHFDLYRLKDPEELELIGMNDYLSQTALCLIEWPQMGEGYLPAADLTIALQSRGDGRIAALQTTDSAVMEKIKLFWKNKDLLL